MGARLEFSPMFEKPTKVKLACIVLAFTAVVHKRLMEIESEKSQTSEWNNAKRTTQEPAISASKRMQDWGAHNNLSLGGRVPKHWRWANWFVHKLPRVFSWQILPMLLWKNSMSLDSLRCFLTHCWGGSSQCKRWPLNKFNTLVWLVSSTGWFGGKYIWKNG